MIELNTTEVEKGCFGVFFTQVTQIGNRICSVIGIWVHNSKYTDEWDTAVVGSQRPIYTSYIVHVAYKVDVICPHPLKL